MPYDIFSLRDPVARSVRPIDPKFIDKETKLTAGSLVSKDYMIILKGGGRGMG